MNRDVRWEVFAALEKAIIVCAERGKYESAAQVATALAALISATEKEQ